MIVLDTNVLSELIKPLLNPRVLDWFDSIDQDAVRITTVTVAEMLAGANLMDDTLRAQQKADLILETIESYHRRTLPFGMVAAAEYATIVSLRASAGRPIGVPDAMIAATAIAAEAEAIATRDKGLQGVGIPVVDPWTG
ncbi:PIN domain-containing protein [Leifsonia sp. 2MCAF36]|uniref:PIN domain-containing protein n=1 Tax=Leifsonia sp. 2MCAF36 TaxID=3232988 RepID=UPI003F9D4AD6